MRVSRFRSWPSAFTVSIQRGVVDSEGEECRTVDLFSRGINHLTIVEVLCFGLVPYAAKPCDYLFCDSSVVGKLSAELLNHAIDVVQLGLVAGRSWHGQASTRAWHVSVHAVNPICAIHAVDAVHSKL